MGLPFTSLGSTYIKQALGDLNSTYLLKSKFTDWNIRHSFLDDEFEMVESTYLYFCLHILLRIKNTANC